MKHLIILAALLTLSTQVMAIPGSCLIKSGYEKELCYCEKKQGAARNICYQDLNYKKADESRKAREALQEQRSSINSGSQSANAGTIVNLGSLSGSGNESSSESENGLMSMVGLKNNHYIGLGMSLYHLPTEPGYKRQMPGRFFPNHISYNYYINPNWSAGVMWQDFFLNGKPFDPITEKQMVDETVTVVQPDGTETQEVRKVEKDIVIKQPGSDTMQIQRMWMTMSFHIDVAKDFEIYAMAGQSLLYDVIYTIDGSSSEKFSPPKPFMAAVAIGYKPIDKDYMMNLGFRFVDSPAESPDMTDYRSPGGAEVFVETTFGVW